MRFAQSASQAGFLAFGPGKIFVIDARDMANITPAISGKKNQMKL
jgi:hypothetical protein